jgi:hypothetical protein
MWRYQPDVDPTTPEVYTALARMIPTAWGTYRTSPSATTLGSVNMGSALNYYGSAILIKTDGTARWIFGVDTRLYDSTDDGANWTNRSGAAYSAGIGTPTKIWQFAQFGDVSLACQLGDNIQASSSGNFADLAGSPPKAALICVQSNAVVIANYNNGSAVTDGWFTSDVADHTNWSTGESASGRLIQTPGAITCLIAYQGRVIAFKDSSIYEGQYVGGVVKWSWRLLHTGIGVSSPNAAATDGRLLFFVGQNGAWVYDGASFSRVDQGLERTLVADRGTSCAVVYSSKEQIFCVYAGFPDTSGTFYAYCPATQLWGIGFDGEGAGAQVSIGGGPVQVPVNYARRRLDRPATNFMFAYRVDGTSYTRDPSSVTTGWIGSDEKMTDVTRVIPLFVPAGDYSYNNGTASTKKATLTVKSAYTRGATMAAITASPVSIDHNRGRFDVLHQNRWFEFKVQDTDGTTGATGGMELAGIKVVGTQTAVD